MAAISVVLTEDSFSGELEAAFAHDPFQVGHLACGRAQDAVQALRAAAKAASEGFGSPQPVGYQLDVSFEAGTFTVAFDTTVPATVPPDPSGSNISAPEASQEELARSGKPDETPEDTDAETSDTAQFPVAADQAAQPLSVASDSETPPADPAPAEAPVDPPVPAAESSPESSTPSDSDTPPADAAPQVEQGNGGEPPVV